MSSKLKIVVATNFSQRSELALDFALVYSSAFDADIYLFHCNEDKASDFRHADRLNEENMRRMKQAVMQGITRVSNRGITHTVQDVHRRMSNGKPWDEVLKIVAGVNADMLIMGHPTQSKFRKTLESCPCSLVLCRDKDPEFVA